MGYLVGPSMSGYCVQDVAELAEECVAAEEELAESKASARLGKRVEAMISRLDSTLLQLEDYIADGSRGLAHVQDSK